MGGDGPRTEHRRRLDMRRGADRAAMRWSCCSGGLDSATVLAMASPNVRCHALSFSYGQRHSVELDAAARVADALGAVEHVVIDIDLRRFGGSALTADIDVPKHDLGRRPGRVRHPGHLRARPQHDLPVLRPGLGRGPGRRRHLHRRQRRRLLRLPRLPARSTSRRSRRWPTWPPRRPPRTAARLRDPYPAHRPDEGRRSSRRGTALGVDYSMTVSCYDADRRRCRLWTVRLVPPAGEGFADAGIDDPHAYQRPSDADAGESGGDR